MILAALATTQLYVFSGREPASIEQKNLFSLFQTQNALGVALEKRVVESINVAKNERLYQINIRNFVLKDTAESLHLCEYFNTYTLTFEAEGIASSGERPTMTVSSPCELSAKTNLPIPIMIPVDDIHKLAPNDTDISFQINPKANFSFRNISDNWPEYWVLAKVEFNSKDFSSRDLIIKKRDLYNISQKPITMNWGE